MIFLLATLLRVSQVELLCSLCKMNMTEGVMIKRPGLTVTCLDFSDALLTSQVELLRSLYKEDLMEEVFVEKPEVTAQRLSCKQMIAALDKALSVLNEVRAMEE